MSDKINSAKTAEHEELTEAQIKLKRKNEAIRVVKFVLLSASAGVIQLVSFTLLNELAFGATQTGVGYWVPYLISLVLSVIWNFTFNRKFTFKSASNIPLAMVLVIIYYAMFIPVSTFGGDALEGIGWNGTLVTVIMMVLNFATEFFWDKFIVFNDRLINKFAKYFKVPSKKDSGNEAKDKDLSNETSAKLLDDDVKKE